MSPDFLQQVFNRIEFFRLGGIMKKLIYAGQAISGGGCCSGEEVAEKNFSLRSLLILLANRLDRWRILSRQRYQLMSMSDYMLKDIGISRADAEREAIRPFWDERGVKW
jgi:uncharacterized protein YjiS (DUF1127 family)